MHHFQYKGEELFAEDVAIKDIVAAVGSPVYIYSKATLERHYRAMDDAFAQAPHTICYSVKANSNLAVLKTFINLGGGVDIVSGGELYRALAAGVDPKKVVYSGVGKRDDEIAYALESGILMFNIESEQELDRISEVAGRIGKKAGIAIRVNPDVDPQTHPYITPDQVLQLLPVAHHFELVPVDHHFGGAGAAVVIAAHGEAVGAGRHERNQVALTEVRDLALFDQEIARFADGTDDIAFDHAVLVPEDRPDAVEGTVERRTGQVVHPRVHDDEIFFLAFFSVEASADQNAGIAY